MFQSQVQVVDGIDDRTRESTHKACRWNCGIGESRLTVCPSRWPGKTLLPAFSIYWAAPPGNARNFPTCPPAYLPTYLLTYLPTCPCWPLLHTPWSEVAHEIAFLVRIDHDIALFKSMIMFSVSGNIPRNIFHIQFAYRGMILWNIVSPT